MAVLLATDIGMKLAAVGVGSGIGLRTGGFVATGLAEGSTMGAAEGVHLGAFAAAGGGILGASFAIPAAQACNPG